MSALVEPRPRFSGHESFACRFSWIPKAVGLIASDPVALSDDEAAMSNLGLGKNMVKALRFWLEAFGVAKVDRSVWSLTHLGKEVFGAGGHDPFLERLETQWLLHWRVTTQADRPLFVWRHVFFRRNRPDFTRAELLAELHRESRRLGYDHSDATLRQHLEVFLHSYISTAREGLGEDALDGPLIDLGLVRSAGRRLAEDGRSEVAYALASARRPPSAVVEYAICDFWRARRAGEGVITLHDLAFADGSPGAALRLSEDDLRAHVRDSDAYAFRVSGGAGALHEGDLARGRDLSHLYGKPS